MPVRNPLAVEIGYRLKRRRNELGLTQEETAELCGLSQQFYACIERGIKSVGAESIIKLSVGLGISVDYILTGTSGNQEAIRFRAILEQLTVANLSKGQYNCLVEIIRNFLEACH